MDWIHLLLIQSLNPLTFNEIIFIEHPEWSPSVIFPLYLYLPSNQSGWHKLDHALYRQYSSSSLDPKWWSVPLVTPENVWRRRSIFEWEHHRRRVTFATKPVFWKSLCLPTMLLPESTIWPVKVVSMIHDVSISLHLNLTWDKRSILYSAEETEGKGLLL